MGGMDLDIPPPTRAARLRPTALGALLALCPAGTTAGQEPASPLPEPEAIVAAAEATGDVGPLTRALDAGVLAADDRVRAALDAARGEALLLDGRYAEAVEALVCVPPESPLQARTRRWLVEAHLELGEHRRAVLAARDGMRQEPDTDVHAWFELAVAEVYDRAGRPEQAVGRLAEFSPDNALYPQAAATRTGLAVESRVVLAWASILDGPLADRWFEPRASVARARAWADLCRVEEATLALADVEATLARQRDVLEAVASEPEAALWSRREEGAWHDAGLEWWIEHDPDVVFATRRVASSAPPDRDTDVRLALGWLRRKADEALGKVAQGEDMLGDVRARIADTGPILPPERGIRDDGGCVYKRSSIHHVDVPYGKRRFRPDPRLASFRYGGADLCAEHLVYFGVCF